MRTRFHIHWICLGAGALLALTIALLSPTPAQAQDVTPTPTVDHSQHHDGTAEATATPLPAVEPPAAGDHAAHHPQAGEAITGTASVSDTAAPGMMGGGMMEGMAVKHEGMASMMADMRAEMEAMMAEHGAMMTPEMALEMGRMMGMMEGMSGMMGDEMMQGGMMDGGMMSMMQGMHGRMMGVMRDMADRMNSIRTQMPAEMAERMDAMRERMGSMMGMMEGMHGGEASGEAGDEGHSEGAAPEDHSAHQGGDAAASEDHSQHEQVGQTEEPVDPHAGHDMSSAEGAQTDHAGHAAHGPVSSEGVPAATAAGGAQELAPVIVDSVKVFTLTAAAVQWPIMDGVSVTAWAYNGMMPGPLLRATEGDQVRIVLTNNLPDATAIHWHGLLVPNAMDGNAPMTQMEIQPGETFVYEFAAKPAGSFMYHSHVQTDKQVLLGLYAPFIVDPRQPEADAPDHDVVMMLSEWRVVDGVTSPAMPMAGMEPNYFTINGKAFPATETLNVKVGDKVRIRFMGIGQFVHPMHLHGMPFKVVATDGYPVPEAAQLTKDTILISPGERYDIEFVATEPGRWMLHCHIPHHITNDGVEPGGLVVMVNVTE